MAGYIPDDEAQFCSWADHFVTTVQKDRAAYQISEQEVQELVTEYRDFDAQYKDAIAARDAAMAAVRAKDEQRRALESRIRSAAKRIQADDRVTNPARKDAGLPIHKTTKKPVPAPSTAPFGTVMLTGRLEQTLTFADSEHKRRRPAGAIGVEIYQCIGESIAPVNPSEYSFVEVCSRGPKLFTFDEKDANKVAHYLLRWINHKGQTGPWSAPVSGTIPAV